MYRPAIAGSHELVSASELMGMCASILARTPPPNSTLDWFADTRGLSLTAFGKERGVGYGVYRLVGDHDEPWISSIHTLSKPPFERHHTTLHAALKACGDHEDKPAQQLNS